MVGRTIGVLYAAPMLYFWRRGYFQRRMKIISSTVLAMYATQGLIGWWMVKSGLKDKNQTNEVDKTPRVSPYRLMVHGGMAYTIYGITFYTALNLLRRPQEDFINLKNIQHHNLA